MNPMYPSAWAEFDAPDAAARLGSRVALLNAAGWLCVVTALVAPPLLCGGAVLLGRGFALKPTGFALSAAGVLVPFAALGLWATLLRGVRSLYVRRLRLARIAAERGWAFREQPAAPQRALLDTFQILASEPHGLGALIWSRDPQPTVATDLRLTLTSHTLFLFPDAARGVPGLIIQPRTDVPWVTGEEKGIEVPGQPEFNRTYALLTSHETVSAATASVTPGLVEFCLKEGNVVVEVRVGHLLVFWERGVVGPDVFDWHLQRAAGVAPLLRRR